MCTRDATEHTCQLVVEGLLIFICVVGAYMLIIVAKLSLLRGCLIVMILSLTGRGIFARFVTISFLIAKPTPASLLSPLGLPLQKKEYSKSLRLPDSENLVSHRAAMSMLIWQVPLLLVPYVFLVGQLLPGRGES